MILVLQFDGIFDFLGTIIILYIVIKLRLKDVMSKKK